MNELGHDGLTDEQRVTQMTRPIPDTPKSARSEGARNGWKTRQKNKQDAPAKVGGITESDAQELRALAEQVRIKADIVNDARLDHSEAIEAFNRKLDSLTAGK